MIVLKNFKEVREAYDTGKVDGRIAQTILGYLSAVVEWYKDPPASVVDLARQLVTKPIPEVQFYHAMFVDMDEMLARELNHTDHFFVDVFGGDMFICETASDLKQIESCEFEFSEEHGRWPNITDKILGFDSISTLWELPYGSCDWMVIFTATCNTGGPLYFVPRVLFQDCDMAAQFKYSDGDENAN